MDRLFNELKRRNVFRVTGVYVVVGWLLAQVATTLEDALGLPAWFDGLIVALLLVGLPVALVLAWAFELTPEGVVRTEAVPEGESITPRTGRKLDLAIVVGLILVGALLAGQRFSGQQADPGTPAAAVEPQPDAGQAVASSIAVLPFADLSPEADQAYFSDGIAEEILNVLVRVDGLDVTSRTSSFQFKGRDLGIPEIARELKVRHVVEGSVRKSGGTIRVTAQLVDASNDRHLWSAAYDRPLTTENIFEIQDEIATSIVAALSDALGVGTLQPVAVQTTTENLTAYELYLQARPLFHARLDLDVADDYLARALEQDPRFAQAWAMRAALQTLMVEYAYSPVPIDEAEETGIEYARQALALEPRSASALAVIGKTMGEAAAALRRPAELAEVFEMFDRALAIDPRNTEALNWRGLRRLSVGYLEAALSDFSDCLGYEPFYVPCAENHYTVLAALGRDEQALEAYIEALDTSSAKIQYAHLPLLVRLGDELAFKTTTNNPNTLWGWRRHDELWEAYKHPERDHRELIRSIREFLLQKDRLENQHFEYITHPLGLGWRVPQNLVLWDPIMARYRQTDAFKRYIRDSGVLDFWESAGYPPKCRPLGGDDFECD